MSKITIILRALSSACVSTIIASDLKTFVLGGRTNPGCHLLFRRLLCRPIYGGVSATSTNAVDLARGSCRLRNIIMGTRHPRIGIRGNTLECSIPRLVGSGTIDGTFRIIGRVPNIVDASSTIRLLKTNDPDVIVGKRLAAVSISRLINLLGAVPTSQMYGMRVVCGTPTGCGVGKTVVGIMLSGRAIREGALRKRANISCLRHRCTRKGIRNGLLCSASHFGVSFLTGKTGKQGCVKRRVRTLRALGSRMARIGRSKHNAQDNVSKAVHLNVSCAFGGSSELSTTCCLATNGSSLRQATIAAFRTLGSKRPIRRHLDHACVRKGDTLRGIHVRCSNGSKLVTNTSFAHCRSPNFRAFISRDRRAAIASVRGGSGRSVSRKTLFVGRDRAFRAK